MRCEKPVKILEILRLSEKGHSQREISSSVGCGKSTVGEVQRRCREANLSYAEASAMSNGALQKLLYPGYTGKKYVKPEPNYSFIHDELEKHPNLNLRFLWEEFKANHPDGLEYSQFCERYNRWKGTSGKKVTMHQEREAGKELFVDWMGDTVPLVIDPSTGER